MMNNEEKIKRLHKVSLKLLLKAEDVMKGNDIKYMLDAGTLLGAIRHKGFIPWDDDADICMMREEYDKFLRIAPESFNGDFEFVLPGEKGDEKFYDFVPKIIYKKIKVSQSEIDESYYNGKYSHPALDIFVIDKVPESKMGQMLHTKLLVFIYGLAMGHRKEIDYSKYSKLEAVVIFILSRIGKLIKLHRIASWYDIVAKWFKNKEKSKVMSTHSAMDHFGDVYEYEWYKDITNAEFEKREFPVPAGYEGVLKKHYKNYMELPPIEKRVPKHLDFDEFEAGSEL